MGASDKNEAFGDFAAKIAREHPSNLRGSFTSSRACASGKRISGCLRLDEEGMPVSKPYRRMIRQFVDGHYAEGGRWRYIRHRMFATDPEHYVRAFAIIQKDILELFDFVEPADTNLPCYSYRIHELFMRTCIEIEANFKAILAENGYGRSGDWNMTDYQKTEASHLLSAYLVKFPVWQGNQHTRQDADL
jgi:hypothetical protein